MTTLPPHIEETLQAGVELHLGHQKKALPIEIIIARITRIVCSHVFMSGTIIVFFGWIIIKYILYIDNKSIDVGFISLSDAGTVLSVCITLLVLVAQRRGNELNEHRDNLILQLVLLGERKNAKIIELLEAMRRENPALSDRYDHEAAQMANPADTGALAEAIRSSHTDVAISAAADLN